MVAVLILVILLILLLFSSTYLKKHLFIFFYMASRRQQFAIAFISLLLYPGVVIHELSHLVAAVILFVPVKDMTLVPKVVEGKIQGGSVVIQKVDVFRRTLVGIAPLFGGLTILWAIMRFFAPIEWGPFTSLFTMYDLGFMNNWEPIIFINPVVQITIVLYLLFSISSTMYSSHKDLEALLYSLPVGIVGIILLYIVGFQASWIISFLERSEAVFINASVVLCIALAIQAAVYLLLLLYSTVTKPIRSG